MDVGVVGPVTTPTYPFLQAKLRACKKNLLVTSPFVGGVLGELAADCQVIAEKALVTRTDIRLFATGASNLATIMQLSDNGWQVRTLPGLHAKLYIFDDTCALVTSANATYSGLNRNLECGIAVADAQIISAIRSRVDDWLTEANTQKPLVKEELQALLAPTEALRDALKSLPQPDLGFGNLDDGLPATISIKRDALLDSVSGWKRLALRGVVEIGRDDFDLHEVYSACVPLAHEQYPDNKHVKAKIRQQLQELRDMGLVEFIARGRYRITFREH